MSKVSYTFSVNNTMAYYKLIGLCVLSGLVLFILYLVGFVYGIVWGEWGVGISLLIAIGGPTAFYYFRRKRTADSVTAVLDEASVEIFWPRKSMVVQFSEIKSYRADHTEGYESASVESVRIRLKDGRKIRLYATDEVCDIKLMGKFRVDFDILAQQLNLERQFFSW